jgi:hypothetical protein
MQIIGMEGKARNARTVDVTKNNSAVPSGCAWAVALRPGNICQTASLEIGDAKYASVRNMTAAI